MTQAVRKALRCAVYTRVSTEHGLEQEFNSLHNQREAAEAYIKSQAHEGWTLIRTSYDDGGFSGASTERPALRQLLADIRAKRIDVVVVYKVDRLTRSLTDFAKLVEEFDAYGVSFVSVTQAFNTTTSMGRLTLNVLLSFAQFEREVTAERIRDKIAASKKKGLHMGGGTPLGYDVKEKRLVVNAEEAKRVSIIFNRYSELGSLTDALADLAERGIVTKASKITNGAARGGIAFGKGSLAYLLKNRVYVGEIVHKDKVYPGEHEPIVDRGLFERVQEMMCSRVQARRQEKINTASLLTGRIFDDRGNRMTPVTANKGGVRYRYYASCVLAQGRRDEAGGVARVSAPDVEAAVLQALLGALNAGEVAGHAPFGRKGEALLGRLIRVTVRRDSLAIELDAGESAPKEVLAPFHHAPMRRRRAIIQVPGSTGDELPIGAQARARLIAGIAKARLWLDDLLSGRATNLDALAEREGLSERSIRMTINLAFLSPALIRAAIAGELDSTSSISSLREPTFDWATCSGVLAHGILTL